MAEVTESVCPICLKRIPAERVLREDGSVILVKTCPKHGEHRDILWKGMVDYRNWRGEAVDPLPDGPDCAHCAGMCAVHERGTCCTLLEITDRCNMNCRFCFADPEGSKDPSLAMVRSWIFDLTIPGKTFLQLSGGEPTVREDLPEVIAFAKKAGCKYIQLNSNGLRLAEEEGYAKKLADAGLSFVFLQFDGITDDVYHKLRRREMISVKERAIANCAACGIGVTLVPVIVPGTNDHQIGDILDFAIAHSPTVRGVHFQPVSYFGRLPKIPSYEDRYTLDQLIRAVEEQTQGRISIERLQPSCCDHPMCGFHADYVVLPEGQLYPLSKKRKEAEQQGMKGCTGRAGSDEEQRDRAVEGEVLAEKNRSFIGGRWKRDHKEVKVEEGRLDMTDMDTFLARVRSHGFTVTAMAFQDAGNIDYERLRRCSLHVYRKGRKRPFCTAYLSSWGEE